MVAKFKPCTHALGIGETHPGEVVGPNGALHIGAHCTFAGPGIAEHGREADTCEMLSASALAPPARQVCLPIDMQPAPRGGKPGPVGVLGEHHRGHVGVATLSGENAYLVNGDATGRR